MRTHESSILWLLISRGILQERTCWRLHVKCYRIRTLDKWRRVWHWNIPCCTLPSWPRFRMQARNEYKNPGKLYGLSMRVRFTVMLVLSWLTRTWESKLYLTGYGQPKWLGLESDLPQWSLNRSRKQFDHIFDRKSVNWTDSERHGGHLSKSFLVEMTSTMTHIGTRWTSRRKSMSRQLATNCSGCSSMSKQARRQLNFCYKAASKHYLASMRNCVCCFDLCSSRSKNRRYWSTRSWAKHLRLPPAQWLHLPGSGNLDCYSFDKTPPGHVP